MGSAIARFSIDPERSDPCKNFRFVAKWDGRCAAGASRMNAGEGADYPAPDPKCIPVELLALYQSREYRAAHTPLLREQTCDVAGEIRDKKAQALDDDAPPECLDSS